jgi:hypothetical protein
MIDEMAALHSNGTWDLVPLPDGKTTVGCRWVYTVKVGPHKSLALTMETLFLQLPRLHLFAFFLP